MKFEEIFKQEGLYKSASFSEGVAFKVKKTYTNELALYTVEYANKNDLIPIEYPTVVYGGLFEKDYEKVLTRQSLFSE